MLHIIIIIKNGKSFRNNNITCHIILNISISFAYHAFIITIIYQSLFVSYLPNCIWSNSQINLFIRFLIKDVSINRFHNLILLYFSSFPNQSRWVIAPFQIIVFNSLGEIHAYIYFDNLISIWNKIKYMIQINFLIDIKII